MIQAAQKGSPERRERDLVWGVLFALRARGIEQLDNTGGLLHKVFGRVFHASHTEVMDAIGFVPQANFLFGEYRCLTEALDAAHRAGHLGFVNPTYRKIVLNLRQETAHRALESLSLPPALALSLAERFWDFYKNAANSSAPTN